jgi:hypothetical protein
MLRKLFLRELIKSAVAHAGIYASIRIALFFADLIAAKRNLIQTGDATFFGSYLLAGLVASGLISGELSFSAAFKAGHYFSLISLPISRSRIWFTLSLSRLSGALVVLPVAFITIPPLLDGLRREFGVHRVPLAVAFLVSAYVMFFSGGLALTLTLRRKLIVYVWGLPFLALVVSALMEIVPYDMSKDRAFFLLVPSLLAFAVILTASSHRSFVEGEFCNSRQGVRRHFTLGMSTIAFLVIALLLARNETIARLGERWDFSLNWTGSEGAISGDGKVLAIVSFLDHRSSINRLQLWDLESGRVVSEKYIRGISQVVWSDSGQDFNLVAWNLSIENSLGFSGDQTSEWYRISRSGDLIARRRLLGQVTVHELISGRLLLVVQNDGLGRGYIADGDKKTLRLIFEGPLSEFPPPILERIDGRDRVTFYLGRPRESIKIIVWDLNFKGIPIRHYEMPDSPGGWWFSYEHLVASRRGVPTLVGLRNPWKVAVSPLALAHVSEVSGVPTVTFSFDLIGCVATAPVCQKNEEGMVQFRSTLGRERAVVEVLCQNRDAVNRRRYWLQYPRSGSMTELKGLPEDSSLIPPGQDGSLLWWTPSGEIWRSVSGKQPYRVGSDMD